MWCIKMKPQNVNSSNNWTFAVWKNPFQRLTACLRPVLDFEQATPKPSFLFLFCFFSHLDSCCITHVCSKGHYLMVGYSDSIKWQQVDQVSKQPSSPMDETTTTIVWLLDFFLMKFSARCNGMQIFKQVQPSYSGPCI